MRGMVGTYVAVHEVHRLGVVEEFPVAEEWIAEFFFAVGVDLVDGESTARR